MRIDEKSADKLEKILNLSNSSIDGDIDLSEAMWEIRETSEDLMKEYLEGGSVTAYIYENV